MPSVIEERDFPKMEIADSVVIATFDPAVKMTDPIVQETLSKLQAAFNATKPAEGKTRVETFLVGKFDLSPLGKLDEKKTNPNPDEKLETESPQEANITQSKSTTEKSRKTRKAPQGKPITETPAPIETPIEESPAPIEAVEVETPAEVLTCGNIYKVGSITLEIVEVVKVNRKTVVYKVKDNTGYTRIRSIRKSAVSKCKLCKKHLSRKLAVSPMTIKEAYILKNGAVPTAKILLKIKERLLGAMVMGKTTRKIGSRICTICVFEESYGKGYKCTSFDVKTGEGKAVSEYLFD